MCGRPLIRTRRDTPSKLNRRSDYHSELPPASVTTTTRSLRSHVFKLARPICSSRLISGSCLLERLEPPCWDAQPLLMLINYRIEARNRRIQKFSEQFRWGHRRTRTERVHLHWVTFISAA